MGMYDNLKSSYNLGEQFTNVVCQTKDLDDCIGGTLTLYWIDPSGVLWKPNYIGTNDLTILDETDPEYNSRLSFLNYKWVRTGKHGKYSVYPITKYVEIYPENWKGEWSLWPRLKLHFKKGILQDYEDITSTKT